MKILIADDERLIHVSIEYLINDLNISGTEIFHAYNGLEMLDQMENNDIDLALTDVQMPGLNGLEAISAIRARSPDTHFYVMSSYSEFEYARKALSLNVSEYLLKPLESEVLERIIQEVLSEMEKRHVKKQTLLRGWLEGVLREKPDNIFYPEGDFGFAVLCTEDGRDGSFHIPQYPGVHSATVENELGKLSLFVSGRREKLDSLRQAVLKSQLDACTTLFVSSIEAEPGKLEDQIGILRRYSPIRVFKGIGRAYSPDELSSVPEGQIKDTACWVRLERSLLSNDAAGYTSDIASAMTCLNKYLPDSRISLNTGKFICAFTGASPDKQLTSDRFEQTLHNALFSRMLQNRVDKLDIILAYISEHCCEDISLAYLAEKYSLTPNYLGTLLKKRIGLKYTDYLTSLRLLKAKELLVSTDLSVHEISKKVGYYSDSHFCKLFQENEKCSPTEFRSNHTPCVGE